MSASIGHSCCIATRQRDQGKVTRNSPHRLIRSTEGTALSFNVFLAEQLLRGAADDRSLAMLRCGLACPETIEFVRSANVPAVELLATIESDARRRT